jgi:hypothetical protein
VTHYPLQANAIVFAYNLPTLLSGGNVLAFRPITLCRIFRGNITRWNDVDIQADNPAMTGLATADADQPIVIPTVSVQTATHYWFSTYCGKVRIAIEDKNPRQVTWNVHHQVGVFLAGAHARLLSLSFSVLASFSRLILSSRWRFLRPSFPPTP